MRIGIDIDDTITNTQDKVDEIAQNIENRIIYDRTKYWFSDRYNCSTDEDDIFYRKYWASIVSSVSLKKDVTKYIDKLLEDGNDIYFITSRSTTYADDVPARTIEYFKKYGINYTDIIFSCNNKAKVCLDYNIDLMIEDTEDNINKLDEAGIKTIVMDNEHNKNVETLRAYSWEEVYKLITGR